MKRLLLASACAALTAAAGAARADTRADDSAPPSFGVAAGWPGGPGQVTVQPIASPTLQTLALTPLTATAGQTYAGVISGATAGSTLTLSNTDGGLCGLSGSTVTCTGLTAGSAALAVTETLAGATNSPNTTPFTITVNALPGYTPNAVALTPLTYIKATQLGTTDTPYGILHFQMRASVGSTTYYGGDNTTIYYQDVLNSLNNGTCGSGACGSENTPGIDIGVDSANGKGTLRLNFNDATTGTNHSVQAYPTASAFLQQFNGSWHDYILAWDFSNGASPKVALVVDGTAVPLTVNAQGTLPSPLNVDINANANGFGIAAMSGNDGAKDQTQDMAQVVLDTSQSYFSGSSILPATVSSLYNGDPVQLDNSCHFMGPSGQVQPQVCLDGPASTFLANKGTSTATFAATATGANTTMAPALFNASIQPNQVPTVPARKWLVSQSGTTNTPSPGWAATISGTSTSFVLSNQGNPIAVGDYLVAKCMIADNGAQVTRAMQTPVAGTTGPAGWNWITVSGMPYTSTDTDGYHQSGTVFYAVAPSAVAAGSDIPLTVDYTAGGSPKSWSCTMEDVTGATSIIFSSLGGSNSGSLSPSAPSITPTESASLMENDYFLFEPSNPTLSAIPATSRIAFARPNNDSGARAEILQLDEVLSSATASGTRTVTLTGTGLSYKSLSILFQP